MESNQWSKAEIKEFAKIWESEVGKKYLAKLEQGRLSWIDAALNAQDPNTALTASRTAKGIDLIISDIYAGIEEAKDKEEKTANKK